MAMTTGAGNTSRIKSVAGGDSLQQLLALGGLLILASAVIPFLFLSQYTAEGLTVLFMTLGCALIGFADDYLKLRRRHSLGLQGRWKMVGLVAVTIVAAILLPTTSATSIRT